MRGRQDQNHHRCELLFAFAERRSRQNRIQQSIFIKSQARKEDISDGLLAGPLTFLRIVTPRKAANFHQPRSAWSTNNILSS